MKRTEGGDSQRCLEAVSRYSETPSKLIIGLGRDGYEALGSPEDVSAQTRLEKVVASLTTIGQTARELAEATGFPDREVKRCLARAGHTVAISGAGVRNDPYRYSIPATPTCEGEDLPESNPRAQG